MNTLSNLDLRPIHITRDKLGETLSRMNPLLMESDIGLILLTDSDADVETAKRHFCGDRNYVLELPRDSTRKQIIEAIISHYPHEKLLDIDKAWFPFKVWSIDNPPKKDMDARIRAVNTDNAPDPYADLPREELVKELITMNGLWSNSATENTRLSNKLSSMTFDATWYERDGFEPPLNRRIIVKSKDGRYFIGKASKVNCNIQFNIEYELTKPSADEDTALELCGRNSWMEKWKVCKLDENP